MSKGMNVSWLIKTEENRFEIWTDEEYSMRQQKCEYYGSKPFWKEVKKIDESLQNIYQKLSPIQPDQIILDMISIR